MMEPDARTEEENLDLALAAELQAALLPKTCPLGCEHHAAAARNRMCGHIGGDFYDFIRIHEDQVALVIGDVTGHGVRASLMMAKILGWLRSEPELRGRPLQAMTALNRMLIDVGERVGTVLPCSMIYAVIDAPTGIAFFVNAGHPRPFLCDRNRRTTTLLGAQNILLGIQEFEPEESCHTFSPGERLVLYTDGLVDAVNARMERFGEDRLRDVVTEYAASGPQPCADAVFLAIDRFREAARQNDDETVVVFDRV